MRYLYVTTSFTNMKNIFRDTFADEYLEAMAELTRMIRDSTILTPGMKSLVLLTPFNTGWEWIEEKQNVKAVEIWSDNNQISELTQE